MHTEEIERPATVAIVKPADSLINQDLITLDPQRYVALVYAPFRDKLATAIAESNAVVIDCTTTAGHAIAIKWRAFFRDEIRVSVESTRVDRKAPILMIGRLIDSEAEAIKAEAKKPEERFDAAIKAEAARKEAIKVADRARIDAIKASIQRIRDLPLAVVGAASEIISAMITATQATQPGDEFEEFIEQAQIARNEALDKLSAALVAQVAIEDAAAAAEQARIAEAALVEAEREELARQRAENERIANEQAAERKRLADVEAAQELAAKQQREAATENARKEADARAEAQRKADAELQAREAAINAKIAAHEAAVKLEADHAEALTENDRIDSERREQAHMDSLALDDAARDLTRCTEAAQAMLTNGRSIIQESASLSAYVDVGLDADRSEGRIDDLGEVVRDLLAMHYTADEIRELVEAEFSRAELAL